MDTKALAPTTVTLLAPALPQLAGKLDQPITVPGADELRQLFVVVQNMLVVNRRGEAALSDAIESPGDKHAIEDLTTQISRLIEANQGFAQELEALVRAIQAKQGGATAGPTTTYNATNIGSGAIAQGGGMAAGQGGVVIGGGHTGDINMGTVNKNKTVSGGSGPVFMEAPTGPINIHNMIYAGAPSIANEVETTAAPEAREAMRRFHKAFKEKILWEEFRTICFNLGIDPHNLPGEGYHAKARELVAAMHRANRLPELREYILEINDTAEV
jgi:hypothetical protein